MLYVNPKYPQILSKSLKTVLLIRFYAFLTKKQKKKKPPNFTTITSCHWKQKW